jgi:hypothetical protein
LRLSEDLAGEGLEVFFFVPGDKGFVGLGGEPADIRPVFCRTLADVVATIFELVEWGSPFSSSGVGSTRGIL